MSTEPGKTTQMVMEIPEDGGHVIVHSGFMRRYLRQMIGDLRGAEMLERIKIHVVCSYRDVDYLHGIRGHVAVDHAVWTRISTGVGARLDALMHSVRVMNPSA